MKGLSVKPKQMTPLTLVFLSLLLLNFSCKENPFPAEGKITPTREEPRDVPPLYTVNLPEVLEFDEGVQYEIPVVAAVPSGNPIVVMSNMPTGMTYDPVIGKLIYNPTYDAATDPTSIRSSTRIVMMTVSVRSSLDRLTQSQRRITVIIRDQPRRMELTGVSDQNVNEGALMRVPLAIADEDFPNGPFSIQPEGLPAGAAVVPVAQQPGSFVLTYTPDFKVVRTDDPQTGALTKTSSVTITAVNPRGRAVSKTMNLKVVDVRQNPLWTVAGQATGQPLTGTIVARVEDPNGEVIPQVRVVSTHVEGVVQLQDIERSPAGSGIQPSSSLGLSWRGFPLTRLNSQETFRIEACVNGDARQQNRCSVRDIQVTFRQELERPPVIDRAAWPVAELKYFISGANLTVPIPIRNGAPSGINPTVVVSAPAGVLASWSANQLTISPSNVTGPVVVRVTATSASGAVSVETFAVDILPAGWAEYLVVGESRRDSDVSQTLGVFRSALMINPDVQELSPRMMVLRKGVVATTASFASIDLLSGFDRITRLVGNVMINSPKVGQITGPIADEIRGFGVSFGDTLALSGPDAVSPVLTMMSPMTVPDASRFQLRGTLTSVSNNPREILVVGQTCRPLVLVTDASGRQRTLAVRCIRAQGRGTLVVAGFEWADISALAPQHHIWMTQLFGQ